MLICIHVCNKVVKFSVSTCQFHSERGSSDTDEKIGCHKRSHVSSSDDLSEIKQLLKKLIKKVDSNDLVLKELQKSQETSITYVCILVEFIQQSFI